MNNHPLTTKKKTSSTRNNNQLVEEAIVRNIDLSIETKELECLGPNFSLET